MKRLIVSLFIFTAISLSQPDTSWTKTFGGSSNDHGYSVQQTTDGGYIIAGRTDSYGNGGRDLWLIKTDSNGDSTWTKTFGGSSNDEGRSVQQTTDGGYIIIGSTFASEEDIWLIKTDSLGQDVWNQTFWGAWGDYS